MFTAKPQKHRAAATTYFDEHLSHNDYYAQTESQTGRWIGQGTEWLRLMPGEPVMRDAFLQLCDNVNPITGQRLTPEQRREQATSAGNPAAVRLTSPLWRARGDLKSSPHARWDSSVAGIPQPRRLSRSA